VWLRSSAETNHVIAPWQLVYLRVEFENVEALANRELRKLRARSHMHHCFEFFDNDDTLSISSFVSSVLIHTFSDQDN
jgi:hypothetical protein